MEIKVCVSCQAKKLVEEFSVCYITKENEKKRLSYCKKCRAEKGRDWYLGTPHEEKLERNRKSNVARRRKIKKFLFSYLQEHPCVDCGESDIACLDFDHVNGEKELAISSLTHRRAFSRVKEEIQKCEVRCANCHRKRHARESNWYRILQDWQ